MKKFLTNMSLQPQGKLEAFNYEAMDNQRLASEHITCFAITRLIEAYVKSGEEFDVVVMIEEDNQNAYLNLETLKHEIAEICMLRNISCRKIVEVQISGNQFVEDQTENFLKIIDQIDDADEIYADLTYGTKPQAITLQMAIQYAYRVKKNTLIQCVAYAEVKRKTLDSNDKEAKIYDITGMIKLDNLIWRLAEAHVAEPRKIIDTMLHL